jgi:hypothetical protein
MSKQRVKPIYNCERLVITPMVDEENEIYGEPLEIYARLMSYDDNVGTSTTELYGDGVLVDVAVDENAGTLALGIHGLADNEFENIFGAENRDGTLVETGSEVPPYCCVALLCRTSKNKVNCRKWPKVRMTKMQETVQQRQGNTSYSTPTLNGTFVHCERLNVKRARKIGVDTSTEQGQAFIENWLMDPDFYSSSGMLNTSTLKVDNAAVTSGSTISSGDTVTFNGSATGGTAPYTYSFYYRAAGSDVWTVKAEDSSTATADQVITVASTTDYEFKIVVKDANGVTLVKNFILTVAPAG